MEQQDLAVLGLRVPQPATTPAQVLSLRAATEVLFNDRAMALMKEVGLGGDDRSLLLALLDDDGQRVQRLLRHLDVDVDALRSQALDDGSSTDGSSLATTGRVGAGAQGDARCVAALVQDLPVSAEAVWALVSDVRRRR